MVSSWHRRAERDGLAPGTAEQRGMGSPQLRGVERDGLAQALQNGEGWSRLGTAERRGMGSTRHRRVESDGLAQAPQSGEEWDRPGTAEWRLVALAPQGGEGSPGNRIAGRDFGNQLVKNKYVFCDI